MGILAWLSLALAIVCAYPAWRFARRAWHFRARPTVIAVIVTQVLALVVLTLLALLAPRPDLGGLGWFAIGLAALLFPLALGDALQTTRLRAVAIVLAVVAGLLTAGISVVAAAPAFATATVAGRHIPATETTLAEGYQLAVHIPPTASGFSSRDAHLFVPSGWIRDPSSTRPIVIMMMGQPGNPTLGATLDALHSLGTERLDDAPFVLVVDQLGANDKNPPCSNTSAGQLETFLTEDVPNWVTAELPVSHDRADWAIAGFSHGGECAAYLGAKHPDLWANVIDISGPDKPGEYRSDRTRAKYYDDSEAEYEKYWPAKVMASTSYADHPMRGIFVAGAEDPRFRQQVEDTATAAENAGWKVTYWAVPGESHSGPTLTKGLATAYNQLIPLWLESGAITTGDRFLCQPDQPNRSCGVTQVTAVAGTIAMVDLGMLAVFLSAQLLLFFGNRGRRVVG
ncbi:alpha/beta hydrolase [Leifsonia aquatica]|uniref:alpha/beta hydrolase n=1 Tax=Leifsonia aquatica TaxID=144185 RepID=UPI0028AF0B31|nr:alpha/beta hydrolase-fold protein [Leifsonia aquatica]